MNLTLFADMGRMNGRWPWAGKTISSAVPMPVAIAQRSSTPSSKPAKMNGINPQAYLADVIERIADHPANRVDELLPWNWTPRS